MNNIRNKFRKMDEREDQLPHGNMRLDNGGGVHAGEAGVNCGNPELTTPAVQTADMALMNDTNPNNSFSSAGGEVLIEYKCGNFRPPLLHRFANIHFFLVCHCVLLLLYGLIYAYIASIQTTLEKQFQINAKRASLLASANMIGYLPSLIVISYYGGRGHRPRYIAVGMLIVTVGSFFASLPFFMYGLKQEAQTVVISYGNNESSVTSEELCLRETSGANSTEWNCNSAQSAAMNEGAYALVFFGMVLVGAGGASVVTLGFPYIDDNVSSVTSPLYLGKQH